MKRTRTFLVGLCVGLMVLGMAASASALLINFSTTPLASGDQQSMNEIKNLINGWVDADAFLYNADYNTGDSGPLSASYSTVFTASGQDETATISYVAGNFIGSPAYLLAKDGNPPSPYKAWYFYDLTALNWDGKETITITGLWPTQGSFSHVSIYGTPVPEPTSLLLLGFGLVGLAGARRMLRK